MKMGRSELTYCFGCVGEVPLEPTFRGADCPHCGVHYVGRCECCGAGIMMGSFECCPRCGRRLKDDPGGKTNDLVVVKVPKGIRVQTVFDE